MAAPGLVQALAVQHGSPNELTGMTDTSAPVLDALQRTLIVSDLLIALPRASGLTATRSDLVADTGGILQRSNAVEAACGDFNTSENARNLGKFAAGFIEVFGKVIQVAVVPLDLFHGLSLALGVKVEALADNLKTHYGHETPGQPLQFPVRVRMLNDLTDVR